MEKNDKIDSPDSSSMQGFSKRHKYTSSQNFIDNGRVYRSRQSARECRQRKKARYKKLDDAIMIKESENLEILRKIEKVFVFWIILIFINLASTNFYSFGQWREHSPTRIRNYPQRPAFVYLVIYRLPNILRRYESNNTPGS